MAVDEAALERKRAQQAEELATMVLEKWGQNRTCPYCGHHEWAVDGMPVLFPLIGAKPGAGIPVYLVRCQQCGVVVPISAEVIGIWPDGGSSR